MKKSLSHTEAKNRLFPTREISYLVSLIFTLVLLILKWKKEQVSDDYAVFNLKNY